jgi:hypothetical protein
VRGEKLSGVKRGRIEGRFFRLCVRFEAGFPCKLRSLFDCEDAFLRKLHRKLMWNFISDKLLADFPTKNQSKKTQES